MVVCVMSVQVVLVASQDCHLVIVPTCPEIESALGAEPEHIVWLADNVPPTEFGRILYVRVLVSACEQVSEDPSLTEISLYVDSPTDVVGIVKVAMFPVLVIVLFAPPLME